MLPTFFIRSQGIRKLYCSLFTPLLERRGLTQLEMDILLFLANNPEYDTARDIVEKRHLAKSHVSVGVDALAGRGLLERQLREGNRKTIHLRLTEKAGPIVEEGREIQVTSLHRGTYEPHYAGRLELVETEEGLVLVNELYMEEYLKRVVPSEMPSSYELEALKAQAVCARSYAYRHILGNGYREYGAHVDDSTSYQVYNNILEQESTTTAVKETYGQLLRTESGDLAGTYYYSTSCGVGSDPNIWKTEAAPALTAYLRAKPLSRDAMAEELARKGDSSGEEGSAGENDPSGIGQGDSGEDTPESPDMEDGGEDALPGTGQTEPGGEDAPADSGQTDPGESLRDEKTFATFISAVNEDDFESGEGWYRWSYQTEELDTEHMLEVLQKRYAANSRLVLTWKDGEYVSETIQELGDITDIYIEKRGSGGVADELVIEAGDQKIKVISEHNIRYVLNDGKSDVLRQDGSRVSSANLLPSGFFTITTGKENGNVIGYTLTGGGFGHGVGMSQNGARAMAEEGYFAEEILLYFYENCAIENIYE